MSTESNNSTPERQVSFRMPDVSSIDMNKLLASAGPDFIPTPGKRGRDAFTNIFFNTGALWMSGFGFGGLYGSIEGFRQAANPSFRIRLNGIINGLSRRGTKIGNALGIIGFLHTSFVGIADAFDLEDKVGHHVVTPVFAGISTGVLIGSSRGMRAAMLAGTLGGAGSCMFWYGGAYAYNVLFVQRLRNN